VQWYLVGMRYGGVRLNGAALLINCSSHFLY